MAKARWTGGGKLKKFLTDAKQAQRNIPTVEVGFGDVRVGVLAAQLEFGNPQTNLPERPAFRLGMGRMRDAVMPRVVEMKRAQARAGKGAVFGFSEAQAREIAILARDTLRQSYRDFHGAELSERQKARKAGTQYADDQLVGSEGPKLIGHIHGYVNGNEVG